MNTFIDIMIRGKQVPNKRLLRQWLPARIIEHTEGERTYYKIGAFEGFVAAWDEGRQVGYITDEYARYITALREHRSER